MVTWLGFFLLQMSFVFTILGLGYYVACGVVNYLGLKKVFWIDRICIGVFVVIFFLAILGVIVLSLPWEMRQVFSRLILLAVFAVSGYFFINKKLYKDFFDSELAEKIFFIGVLVMSAMGLAISLLPVKLPSQLVDGPYVVKHDYLGVRVQYITGNLPTDNSIPHVVSEYLLRDVSFNSERPIMPGQEVSNRPILVSLVLIPIRAAFSLPLKLPDGLPKFNYVGTSWPDFSVLMQDDSAYLFSLSIGMTLNALIFLAVGAFAVRMQNKSTLISTATVALMLTSPYFIFQTIFTWPKELAAFFVLYSILLYYKVRKPILAGAFLAFGYLSHPYAIVFIVGFILHTFYDCWQNAKLDRLYEGGQSFELSLAEEKNKIEIGLLESKRHFFRSFFFRNEENVRNFTLFLLTFSILVAPWLVWSKVILYIPSDLIMQNFILDGQRLVDFIWVRPVNFFSTILPVQLVHYPFKVINLVLGGALTIPGAIGIFVFVFSLISFFEKKPEKYKVFNIYIPSIMLILLFSNQAVPVMHGLQGPIALLLVLGVMQMQKMLNIFWVSMLLSLQIIINMLLLSHYFYNLV